MLVTDLLTLVRDIGRASDVVDDDAWNDAYNRGRSIARTTNDKNYTSIKQASRNMIASYPVLVSDNISTDTAYLLSNAFEHEYAYLVSLIINNQIAYSGDIATASDVVSRFHRNITRYESYDSDNISLNYKFNMNNINHSTFPKSFNESSTKRRISTYMTDRNGNVIHDNRGRPIPDGGFVEITGDEKLSITDKDIRKYNDLTPMILQLKTKICNGQIDFEKEIAIGVKTLIHKLPSAEVCLNLSQAVKGSSALFKFVRWTTGELKLVRDLILCVDENKKYAKDSLKQDSFWWKKLDDMYKMNKMYKWLRVFADGSKNLTGPIPTVTLVISMTDVNNIKSMYGIDLLKNTEYTRKMFNKLSLLTFAIVDESIETVYLYDENNRFFTPYPFRSIKVKKSNDGSVNIEDLKPLFKR